MSVHQIAADVHMISRPIPVDSTIRQENAVVLGQDRPILIETTFPSEADGFLADLATLVDLSAIELVAITHADPDHSGALVRLLLCAPDARVLTNEIGMVKLIGDFGLPRERFDLVEPGRSGNAHGVRR